MRWIKLFFVLLWMALLSISIVSAQSDECPMIVQDILMTVGDVCDATGRNQVCYGNVAITAEGRNDAFRLDTVGDVANLSDMQSLSLSPYDEEAGIWGVALMRLQANLPDTLPGQNVTMLAFGDVSLTNAINAPVQLTATLSTNGRTRRTPTTADGDLNVLTAIPSGTSVEVLGRNERGDWLLIRLPEASIAGAQFGWISTQVLRISGDRMGLNIFADDVLNFGTPPATTPMSAFYLKTGIGQTNCAEMPPDGVLIQTPKGAGRVQMTVNGVQMSFGSTVFLKTVDNLLAVMVVEGTATVTANNVTQFVPAGAEVVIPLNEDLTAPIDVPSNPLPYKPSDVSYLPITESTQLVPEVVTLIDPLTPEDIDTAIAQAFAPYGAIDGLYSFNRVEIITHVAPNYTGGFCNGGGESQSYTSRMQFTAEGIVSTDGVSNGLAPIANGVWGDPDSAHQALYTLGASGTQASAHTFRALSVNTIQEKRTAMINNVNGLSSSCTGIYIGTWIAP